MDIQDQKQKQGEISRLLMEKAKKGFEFAKMSDLNQKSYQPVGEPTEKRMGIDRNRWAD